MIVGTLSAQFIEDRYDQLIQNTKTLHGKYTGAALISVIPEKMLRETIWIERL